MLSDTERRVLFLHCSGHAVASCELCRRDYTFTELDVEVGEQRCCFCPSCCLDLVDDVRLHILGCPVIAAALYERVERSRDLKKDWLSSAVLARESEARAERVLDIMRRFRSSRAS